MKYFVRSVKYFIYFSLLCTLIVYALVLTGMASGDINEIFEGGYDAIWKIAVFFALVAAVYPKFGFITRKIETDRSWEEVRIFPYPRDILIEQEGEIIREIETLDAKEVIITPKGETVIDFGQ